MKKKINEKETFLKMRNSSDKHAKFILCIILTTKIHSSTVAILYYGLTCVSTIEMKYNHASFSGVCIYANKYICMI